MSINFHDMQRKCVLNSQHRPLSKNRETTKGRHRGENTHFSHYAHLSHNDVIIQLHKRDETVRYLHAQIKREKETKHTLMALSFLFLLSTLLFADWAFDLREKALFHVYNETRNIEHVISEE